MYVVCESMCVFVLSCRQIVLTFKVSVMATIHFVQSEKLGEAWEQGWGRPGNKARFYSCKSVAITIYGDMKNSFCYHDM